MTKTILVDLGGTLILNQNNQAVLNKNLFELLKKYQSIITMIILSDTTYDVTQILNDFNITKTFTPLVITKYLYPINKRDPETYLFACKKAGISPADCLLIDNESDFIKAANDAGIKSINPNNLDAIEQLLRE